MKLDFSNCKNMTEIKQKVRVDMTALFKQFLEQTFGAESVSQTGLNKLGVAVGETTDADGFTHDVCAEILTIAKQWTDIDTETTHRLAYDRLQEEEDYLFKQKEGHTN